MEKEIFGIVAHDVNVKALFRLATLYNIPFAGNEATTDLIVKSIKKTVPLRSQPDFSP